MRSLDALEVSLAAERAAERLRAKADEADGSDAAAMVKKIALITAGCALLAFGQEMKQVGLDELNAKGKRT